ncbi:MAG: right-handed parallel beta-helix repeat-containing protein [Ignavibacteriales bacterium]|nr:right-handed parallel beta-helix repeat-containing protein [Ignavibacteriales bacterium]
MKSRLIKKISEILLISIVVNIFIINLNFAQGKFLRGETNKDYTLENKKADFYISVNGNDKWSGKLAEPNNDKNDGPFATIGRAKVAVQNLKQEIYQPKLPPIDKRFIGSDHKYGVGRDILVLIRDGIYSLDSIIVFASFDGGERVETDLPTGAFEYHKLKDYYVTYAAFPGEHPIISGGSKISNWQKSKDHIWRTTLDEENVTELFSNGKRQTLARSPNSGYYYTDGIPTDPNYFKFRNVDLKNWSSLESNNLTMIVRWSSIYSKLKSVDEKNKIAYLAESQPDMLIIPPKYFVENVEALLDTSGEWYFNSKNKVLSYFPDEGINNPNSANITLPKLNGLIKVSGDRENPVRNLRFMNLTFQATNSGGTAVLDISYAKNCEITSNNIQNVSQTAIKLGLGCYKNLITKNKIKDVKGNGIDVRGVPKPENWEDVVYDNVVSFNEVENCLAVYVGIAASNTIRTTVKNNYVNNVGSYGLSIGSWPNVEETTDGNYLVEFNHIEHANMLRDDEGGIAVYGLSPGSIVKNNVVHDVRPAGTNENVGFFFQNMSSGWEVTNNIFYNLKQGEMKLCAAYITDNVYENNFSIDTPDIEAEKIINGNPTFLVDDLKIISNEEISTGKKITISAEIKNIGSSGIDEVILYVDGKIAEKKLFPIIRNNKRTIEFYHQFYDPGIHSISINESSEKEVSVKGESLYILYDNMTIPIKELPLLEKVEISAKVKNVRNYEIKESVKLFVDGKIFEEKNMFFQPNEEKIIEFSSELGVGEHEIKIGNLPSEKVKIYEIEDFKLNKNILATYCSTTAEPCNFDYNVENNYYEITASGTDFLHAEDSYGTIFLNEKIKGDFVATLKLLSFDQGVSEWFRAGLFVRNDLTKSNIEEIGSKGSFLLFSTPKRIGAQWDEFGDGSMHNTKSWNYNLEQPFPVWLKVIRHGNKFTGFYSLNNKDWIIVRESPELEKLSEEINIGIAAGTNDQRPSKVTFEDFKILSEK